MGSRGPKPVNVGLLCTWEFEFYKALHLLRDGTQLPAKFGVPIGLTPAEQRKFISLLKRMNAVHYWLTSRRLAVELGEALNLRKPPSGMDLRWAEQDRAREIQSLELALKPRRIEAQVKRQRLWKSLVNANTYAALRRVCGRWAHLPDVRLCGMTPFPQHVVENAAAFLSMKANQRFPRSDYGDDARLEYLARGMAGVLCGIRPMTGIERLRNMKHKPGGPLWIDRQGNHVLTESDQYCGCWRCSIEKSNKVTQVTQTWYENGLKFFMELAETTKVPSEWIGMRKAKTYSL